VIHAPTCGGGSGPGPDFGDMGEKEERGGGGRMKKEEEKERKEE
jgi:hypothetical protein